MPTIIIDNLGREVPAMPGQSLLGSLLHDGQPIHTRCGGKARCGCCRVRVLSDGRGMSPRRDGERSLLGEENIAQGWRLACQTHILRDITIHLPTAAELDPGCSGRRGGGKAP